MIPSGVQHAIRTGIDHWRTQGPNVNALRPAWADWRMSAWYYGREAARQGYSERQAYDKALDDLVPLLQGY